VEVIRKLKTTSLNVTKLAVAVEIPWMGRAIRQPSVPPTKDRHTDSKRNEVRMLHLENPRALNVPISRDRDITAPYIIFMAAKQEPIPIKVAINVPRILIPTEELVWLR